MINKSGLYPKGHAVLVQAYEPEVKALSTTLFIPDSVRQSFSVLENRVVVVAIGSAAWDDEASPRAAVGDTVFVTKHAGFVATGADGEMYRLVNDRDIFCVIDRAVFEAAKAAA
jgi:co-chaperonin GroES (HSP10)